MCQVWSRDVFAFGQVDDVLAFGKVLDVSWTCPVQSLDRATRAQFNVMPGTALSAVDSALEVTDRVTRAVLPHWNAVW